MATITNIEDLKKIYKRRVPKMFLMTMLKVVVGQSKPLEIMLATLRS